MAEVKAAPALLAAQPRFTILPPLSLYVHVPWCVRKCPYCDFNSHEARGELPEREYVDTLIADLDQALPLIWGRPVYTIFFGGGTPACSAPRRSSACSPVRARAAPDRPEITLEANPGTFEKASSRPSGSGRQPTVDRDTELRSQASAALGRIHDEAQARNAVDARSRISRTSTSICHALPGQTLRRRRRSLVRLEYAPPHLSVSPHYRAEHAVPSPSAAGAG